MSNSATFKCTYVTNKFEGQQNQTGAAQNITVSWFDSDGNLQQGSTEMQPNDYAVMDENGNWKVYTPADFARLFVITDNF